MDFNIIGAPSGLDIDGCAQFEYKGFQISMSTSGRSKGACPHPVAIFEAPFKQMNTMVAEFYTVEEAVRFIDGDRSAKPYRQIKEFALGTNLFEISYMKFKEGDDPATKPKPRLYQMPSANQFDALVEFGKMFNDETRIEVLSIKNVK